MGDFDTMLWRPLRSGNEYDALFPITSCKSTYVGNGNTDFSIDEMEIVIEQYAFQTEKVARKLQKPTLKATTDNIHDFLFNHFQYLADESNQLLRSPACSWFTRKKGIDCKSYSILASCILTNLEIEHYIRKIKQPGYAPDEYTHVYVIVPTDQQTGNLESGYHTIDGTLKSNIEPAFIGFSDLQMSLPHYSLNGAIENQPLNGLSFNEIKSVLSFANAKNFIKNIGCYGINGKEKSSLTPDGLKKHVENVDKLYSDLFLEVNQAVINKNYGELNTVTNEIMGYSRLLKQAAIANKAKGWNSCTAARIDIAIQQFEFYQNKVGVLYQNWLAKYFNQTGVGQSILYKANGIEAQFGLRHVNSNVEIAEPMVGYVPKSNTNIPAFVLDKYVQTNLENNTTPDANVYLQGLEAVGNLLQATGGNNSGTLPNGGYATGNNGIVKGGTVKDFNNATGSNTSNAGMGWFVGIAVASAGYFALKNSKNIKK